MKATSMNNAIISIMRGLLELHSLGIVHGHLNPSNAFFTPEDPVSSMFYEREPRQALLYLSPEIHDGGSPTKASDVWSLGVTIYELLTGQSAFQMPLKKLIQQVDSDERPAVPSIACPELAEVIRSCWDRDPGKRMTMIDIVQKLSPVGCRLVEGADPRVTKAFLQLFPFDARSSRTELQRRLDEQTSKNAALESEIAILRQTTLACESENAMLRFEASARIADPAALRPLDVVRVLVEGHAVLRAMGLPAHQPSVVPKQGEVTRLHNAARLGDVDAILEFANQPEFVNARTAEGGTPMSYAAYYGQTDAVKALASMGAYVDTVNNDAITPIYLAAEQGHLQTVRALGALGANVNFPNSMGATPLFIAARNGHELVVRALISFGADVNAQRNDGIAPIYIASQNGHEPVVRALASSGADVNRRGLMGATPLYVALAQGNWSTVRALLSLGADVNAACTNGWTPLMAAAGQGDQAIVLELLVAGAHAHAMLPDGNTPMTIAQSHGHWAVVRLIATA
jgi:ankyrin repeat protein